MMIKRVPAIHTIDSALETKGEREDTRDLEAPRRGLYEGERECTHGCMRKKKSS